MTSIYCFKRKKERRVRFISHLALFSIHTLVTVGDVKEEIFFMMFLCART